MSLHTTRASSRLSVTVPLGRHDDHRTSDRHVCRPSLPQHAQTLPRATLRDLSLTRSSQERQRHHQQQNDGPDEQIALNVTDFVPDRDMPSPWLSPHNHSFDIGAVRMAEQGNADATMANCAPARVIISALCRSLQSKTSRNLHADHQSRPGHSAKILPSEITPETAYLNRRTLLQAALAAGVTGLGGAWVSSARAEGGADLKYTRNDEIQHR